MSRHIVDHRAASQGERLKHFLKVERLAGEEGSHPVSKELRSRAHATRDTRRVKEFLRIDRGQTV